MSQAMKKPAYTGWKDEHGLLLYDGDIVHVKRIGKTLEAVVYWNGEWGRWMMGVRGERAKDGTWSRSCALIRQDITLCGSRFTRRARGVRKVG